MFYHLCIVCTKFQSTVNIINASYIYNSSSYLFFFLVAIKNASRKFNICVVCISSSGANDIREKLTTKAEIYSRVNVQVKPIDHLQGEFYDLIILLLTVKDHDELKTIQENSINVALTSSRFVLWLNLRVNFVLSN